MPIAADKKKKTGTLEDGRTKALKIHEGWTGEVLFSTYNNNCVYVVWDQKYPEYKDFT